MRVLNSEKDISIERRRRLDGTTNMQRSWSRLKTSTLQRFSAIVFVLLSVFLSASGFSFKHTVIATGKSLGRKFLMTMTENNFSGNGVGSASKLDKMLPTMIVFDLDDCLWSPEMYTLRDIPSIPEEGDLTPNGVPDLNLRGCVGMKVPHGPTVKLFSGARLALYELASNPLYKGIILASASSSEEPTFSYSCLRGIEILPGLSIDKMFQYNQIGRSGPLSPDKRTHFRLLHKESNVPYNEMIFFDDCNWGDHCATVSREFGVVTMRTPRGLQHSEFQEALDKFRREVENRE